MTKSRVSYIGLVSMIVPGLLAVATGCDVDDSSAELIDELEFVESDVVVKGKDTGLVWCYAEVTRGGDCKLVLGDAETCAENACDPTPDGDDVLEELDKITPLLPTDSWFCYGQDEKSNSCELYWGTKELCDSLEPCTTREPPVIDPIFRTVVAIEGDTYCYGWNEVMNQCLLYLGTKERCESLPECPGGLSKTENVGIEVPDLTMCYGRSGRGAECTLVIGDAKACENLIPC